tara:strand:+ start:52 stop:666 length:615 start_codon:yes stop_codon:yes gene_type:complete
MNTPTIGWSDFAAKRHKPGTGFSYSTLHQIAVADLTSLCWDKREPGAGETGLDRKVVVPVPPDSFVCTTALITEQMRNALVSPLKAVVSCRQEGEDLFIGHELRRFWAWLQRIEVKPEPCNYAKVVCYSHAALLENGGTRTIQPDGSVDDWEIVCIIASPVENEPMPPLTMARNMLEKAGGTMGTYTSEEFAESVYYWSQRIRI